MNITSKILDSLIDFTFAFAAKTEGAKFLELFQKWHQRVEDIGEDGKTRVFYYKPMLAKVRQKFPFSATRQNYARRRLEILKQNKTELKIMSQFMLEEREFYKTMDRLKVQKSPVHKSGQTCFNCDKPDQTKINCPESRKKSFRSMANSNPKHALRNCPAYQGQHMSAGRDGKTFYKTRLSSCDHFMSLSVSQREFDSVSDWMLSLSGLN